MSKLNINSILKQVEALLAQAGALPTEAEQAVEKLLNVVEALSSDKKELADEVDRLRQDLEKKKKTWSSMFSTLGWRRGDQGPKAPNPHRLEARSNCERLCCTPIN